MNGYDQAKETALRIKGEVHEDKMTLAGKALLNAQLSPEVLEFVNRNLNTGVEDLNTGVFVPQLRIHSAGISTKNQLVDGSEPKDGQIYYTGTQESWESVRVVILSIKKCRLEQQDDNTGEKKMQATYLVSGLLDESNKPFVMYVKGMSYNKIWELEEELKPYVTKRAGGIPLNMLKVMIGSTKEKVTQGRYKGQMKNVFTLSLVLHESGEFPVLETDMKKLEMYEQSTQSAERMLLDIIAQKGMTEKEYSAMNKSHENSGMGEPIAQATVIVDEPENEVEDVSAQVDGDDDIPF